MWQRTGDADEGWRAAVQGLTPLATSGRPSGALGTDSKTLRNVKSAWNKEMRVALENDKVSEYQVNMLVTFVLDT